MREIAAGVAAHELAPGSIDARVDRALLRTYLSQDGAVPDDDDEGGALLAAAVTLFGSGGFPPSLFSGAGRVGFGVAHLAAGEEADEVCGAIESALMRRLEETPWTADYDLIIGLVGIGVCGLERSDHDGGRALCARVLDQLEATARERGGGVAWHTSPDLLPEWQRQIAPEGYWNLGLAHGNPGVAALLARMVSHGVETDRARALLEKSMTFLLGAEPPRERGRYPSWHPAADEKGSTRLAWCYGDLGACVAFLSAAQATGNAQWRDEALTMARACATRTFDEAAVHDAGLCHGTIGAAHIFNRLWQATGEDVFANAARTWIDHTFRIRNDQAIAGFPSAAREPPDYKTSWNADDSLLSGAIGVALALHAAVSEVEPTWDRLLLADLPIA
ncbi:MAG TPA: lanthionine synthetase C family protein [Kofleriaceae bacterium]|nr:lanthionine synthetase C family protein [Kofleriaceae bacterium]